MKKEKKTNIFAFILLVGALTLGLIYSILNQYEAYATIQCGDDLPDSVFPIEDGEVYEQGVIKLTSYLQNKANLYEPTTATYHPYPEESEYEKSYSYIEYERGKCIIDITSNWDFR